MHVDDDTWRLLKSMSRVLDCSAEESNQEARLPSKYNPFEGLADVCKNDSD